MESSIKKENGLKREIEFIVPVEEVKASFLKNYQKLQKKVKMPGFRPGKVPLKTLQANYKSEAHEAVVDDLFRSFYLDVLKENQMRPVGPPTLLNLDLEEDKPCKFLVSLEVHPKIKIQKYTDLELKKSDTTVKEEDVNNTLERLRQSAAKFEDLENKDPLKKGDFVTMNVQGFLSDKKEKKIDYKNLLLEIGADMISPGFDAHLIGLSLSEKKEFDFIFPKENQNQELAGHTFQIQVELMGFKSKKIPELNNELAKQFKVDSLDKLKQRIKDDLKKNLEQKAKEEMENNIVKQLVENNPIELPQSLIQEQKQNLIENSKKRLKEYKMSQAEQDTFLKEQDPTFDKEAKQSLHASYLIEQLIQDLKIETTDEDIEKSLQESFPSKKPEDMKTDLKKGKYWDNFIFNLTRKKVISFLIEKSSLKN